MRSVAHVHINGDLDSAHLVEDVRQAIAQVEGAEVLVIEVGARRWRGDVVLAIAKALRPEGERLRREVFALLTPRAGAPSAGFGALALGVLADACYVTPRSTLTHVPSDELTDLIPEGVDRDAIDRELRGLAWTALQERGGDALLTSLVPRPSAALFASRDDAGTWKLASEPVATGERVIVVPGPVASGEIGASIDADLAQRIGLAAGQARSVSEVLAKQMIRPKRTQRFEVAGRLGDARRQFAEGVASIDEARRKAKGAIDAVFSSRAADMLSKQRRAGKEQRAPLEAAGKDLQRLERLVQEYPELMRAAPPGTTEIGQTAQNLTYAWRDFFQARRRDIEYLHARAVTLSEK